MIKQRRAKIGYTYYILLSLEILMTLLLSLCTFRIWIEEMATFFQISKFLKITKVSFLNLNLLIGRNHSFLTRTFSMHMTPALHDHYLSSEYNSYNTAYFMISQKTPISTLSIFILIRANHVKGLNPWIRCPIKLLLLLLCILLSISNLYRYA